MSQTNKGKKALLRAKSQVVERPVRETPKLPSKVRVKKEIEKFVFSTSGTMPK